MAQQVSVSTAVLPSDQTYWRLYKHPTIIKLTICSLDSVQSFHDRSRPAPSDLSRAESKEAAQQSGARRSFFTSPLRDNTGRSRDAGAPCVLGLTINRIDRLVRQGLAHVGFAQYLVIRFGVRRLHFF